MKGAAGGEGVRRDEHVQGGEGAAALPGDGALATKARPCAIQRSLAGTLSAQFGTLDKLAGTLHRVRQYGFPGGAWIDFRDCIGIGGPA